MNDKPIIITESFEKRNNYEVFNFDEINFQIVKTKVDSNEVLGIYLVSRNIKKDWIDFQKNFNRIEAAGGKVTNEKNEVLFIYRFDKWDLPKGHIEKGEHKESAAVREVEEECGISGLILGDELETTYHVFEYNNELRLKVTYWFEMNSDFIGNLVPQIEEGITKVMFKNEQGIKMALENTYENIKLLFK